MSKKWQQVKRWDAEHLTGPLAPVRWVLHTLSTISLAVVLLAFVGIYGALASIPIGLVALAPTLLVIGLSAVVSVVLCGGLVVVLTRLVIPASKAATRFTLALLLGMGGGAGGFLAWQAFIWPAMRYTPETDSGLRFFGSFVEAYGGTTLRRLPGFEMTELEFYSWWPMKFVLLLFVVNMMTATVRRIEFNFKNLGVLTVHTGIIVIALGSIYYQAMKKEGDSLLRAGMPGASGETTVGQPVRGFFDNTAVTLWVAQREIAGNPLWESRPLRNIPRYNDYNLTAAVPRGLMPLDDARVIGPLTGILETTHRELDLAVPTTAIDPQTGKPRIEPMIGRPRVDPDLEFRVVGYAEYAREDESLIIANAEDAGAIPPEARAPIRVVELLSRVPDADGKLPDPDAPAFAFTLNPSRPSARLSEGEALAVEYTTDMPAQRRADLMATLPEEIPHALVIEVPAAATGGGSVPRMVVEARPGLRHLIGETGWAVGIREVLAEPPFPIITDGYQGAQSSVAVVQISTPDGEVYDRYVYHRYPAINQDLLGTQPDGMPSRRNADPGIHVAFVDASKLQLYFNDRTISTGDGTTRTATDLIIREPGGPARLIEDIGLGEKVVDVVDKIDFRVAESYDHAVRVRHPVPVPEIQRDGQMVGTHGEALLAVEVSADDVTSATGRWSTIVWVPYLQYLGTDPSTTRTVTAPGGRDVTLQFGRIWHGFPGFSVQLINFEMIAYDHRGAPRDYQSLVRVSPTSPEAQEQFTSYEHVTKLNAPLQAPYIWSDERGTVGNVLRRLTNGMNPQQFKLSQAGWDRDGWTQTQQMADNGELPGPFARYTILQVGNNPGIHVIALGGVLMAIGIPWAFYVKPWLVRRERDRLMAQAGVKKTSPRGDATAGNADAADQEGAAQPAQQS